MHQFCMECGAKNFFELKKPKFCCECGEPFNQIIQSKSKKSIKKDEAEEEEGTQEFDIEQARKGIRLEMTNASTKVEDIIATAPHSQKEVRPEQEKESGKDLQNLILKECATSRTTIDE